MVKKIIKWNWLKSFTPVEIDPNSQVHANQFWWAWLYCFWRFCSFLDLAKFPFWKMDYIVHEIIESIGSKKFMQLGVDVKCMHTNFGGCGFCFWSYCYFQIWPISLSNHGSDNQNWLKEYMQVGVDVKCMHTNFGGPGLSGFRNIANGQISLLDQSW